MIKLLALDLDDTCLNWSNKILPKTMEMLKKAAKSGIEIVFVTGRAYQSLPYQLENENFFRYVITSNGASVFDRVNKTVVYSHYLPQDTALEVLKKAREYRLGLTVHVDNQYVVEGKKLALLGKVLFGKDSKNIIKTNDIIDYIGNNGEKIEELHLFFFSQSKESLAESLRKQFSNLHCPKGSFCLEMVKKEATKGNALEWLYSNLGLVKGQVACVGDSENDIPMFKKSGLKFAVSNATEHLKSLADFVVPTNDENGVSVAIEKILNNYL